MRKRIALIIILLIICVGALAAGIVLKKIKVTFEGGNISLQYAPLKWKLNYQKEEPYSMFCLEGEDDYILIVSLESEGRILEAFHEEMLVEIYRFSRFSRISSIGAEEKIDQWEEKGYWYYIDDWNTDAGNERWITFEKSLGNTSVICMAQISRTEDSSDEKVLQEKTDEVLMILSSITYSEKNEIKGISQRNDLLSFYTMVLEAEQIGEVTALADRTKDYVPNEEAAKEIAEAFFDENDPGWKDDIEYEVEVIFIEEIYKWIIYYFEKGPEGTMVVDGSEKIVRIRRDNGEVTSYYFSW